MSIIIDYFIQELRTEYQTAAKKDDASDLDEFYEEFDNLDMEENDMLRNISLPRGQSNMGVALSKHKSISLAEGDDDQVLIESEKIVKERANLFFCMEYILQQM